MSAKVEIFVLLADTDGTLRSSADPIGVAVTTEAEAQRFLRESRVGYRRSYVKVTVFSDTDAALKHAFPEHSAKEKRS